MPVFRADGGQDQPAADEEDWDPEKEPADEEGAGGAYADEREQLNLQRSRFERSALAERQAPAADEEEALQALGPDDGPESGSPPAKSGGGRAPGGLKKMGSKINKKIALGLGLLLVPTMVGLVLFLIGLQLGFTLDHIERVSTGVRFGSLHALLSRRFNHIRREYVRTTQYQTTTSNQFTRYTKTTLGHRLLGVTPDKIYRHLNQKGYKFKYSTLRGGSLATVGRKTLTEVEYPDGSKRQIRNSEDARLFIRDAAGSFDDLEVSKFRAMRSSFLLAKQIGIPFLRFRVIIDGLRDGSLKNLVRGSPGEFVNQRIDEEMLGGKQRLARKLPRLGSGLEKFGAAGLVEDTRQNLAQSGQSEAGLTQSLREAFDGRQRAFVIASAGSIAVSVLTFACVIRELGVMIREASKMKIRGLQDNAATLVTVNSQVRAGDMSGEVLSDLNQRFSGFPSSATYQAATNADEAGAYVGLEGSDYSDEFGADQVFDGWAVSGLFHFSNLLSPSHFAQAAQKTITESLSGFWKKVFGQILKVVGAGVQLTVGYLEAQFKTACQLALNNAVQIGILAVEILATIVITILSGGLGGGAKVGAGQVIKTIMSSLGRSVVVGVAGGIALDVLLFDYLLPNVVKNAAGADTALLLDAGNAANGARNYAGIDYGMHYLKEAEALNLGGSRIPVEEALTQTRAYLAWDRQQQAEKGWFNHVFALDNPYSLAARTAAQYNPQHNWRQQGYTYLASLWSSLKSGLDPFQPVYAQSDPSALARLMYPGQTTVISFDDRIMSGQVEELQHVNNTVYVEDNFEDLYEKYSQCLNLDAAEFLLTQNGASTNEYGHPYYPEECDSFEAQRYKTYYQDCLLIDGLQRQGTNSSPMLSSACDHLLPTTAQDTLFSSHEPDDWQTALQPLAGLGQPGAQADPEPSSELLGATRTAADNQAAILLSWRLAW